MLENAGRLAILFVLLAILVTVSVVVVKDSSPPSLVAARQPAQSSLGEPCCVICTPTANVTRVPTPIPTVVLMPSTTPTAEMPLDPTPYPTPLDGIQTSPKKGVAVEVGTFASAEQAVMLLDSVGAAWWYDWTMGGLGGISWEVAAQGKPYVPMLRKEVERHKGQIGDIIEAGYRGGYWLIGNEPDNSREDDMGWEQAARVYGEITYYILSRDPSARIIMLGLVEPKSWWVRRFKAAWGQQWGESPPVAGWHVHIYPGARQGKTVEQVRGELLRNLKGFGDDFPDEEVWVSEFGYLDAPNRQIIAETIVRVGNTCEELPAVTRYAYFLLGGSDRWETQSLYSNRPWPSSTSLLRDYQQVPMPDWRRLSPAGALELVK